MATEYGSIDDLLGTGKNDYQPAAPEHQPETDAGYDSNIDEAPKESHESFEEPSISETTLSDQEDTPSDNETIENNAQELDAYGNEQAKPRTYTQEEVNEMFRRRFKNKPAAEQQMAMQQVQQATAQGFEFDPASEQSLPQQLETFIEQTVNKISHRQQAEQQRQREEQAEAEFKYKFEQGMNKFRDFEDVVSSQPITPPMTVALRGLQDPASFIYAASKRHPQELQRISTLTDPVAQVLEMGRLEERMRKQTDSTKAPRPIARTKEDMGLPKSDKKNVEPSIEDLIAKAEAKKRAQLVSRRGR